MTWAIPCPSTASKAELIGRSVAGFALTAIADPAAKSLEGKDAKLHFRTAKYAAQIANTVYHFANMLGIYKRTTCCYDMTVRSMTATCPRPRRASRIFASGRCRSSPTPASFCRSFLGGYDGSRAGTYTFIDLKREPARRQPRAQAALSGRHHGRRAAHRMTFGLTMDFLGYIVPRYNWVLGRKPTLLR